MNWVSLKQKLKQLRVTENCRSTLTNTTSQNDGKILKHEQDAMKQEYSWMCKNSYELNIRLQKIWFNLHKIWKIKLKYKFLKSRIRQNNWRIKRQHAYRIFPATPIYDQKVLKGTMEKTEQELIPTPPKKILEKWPDPKYMCFQM